MQPMSGGEILKKLRKKKGYTQRELADKSGISLTYISRLERAGDDIVPKKSTIDALVSALEASPEDTGNLLTAYLPELAHAPGDSSSDRKRQSGLDAGSSIWIVSDEPAEVVDDDYRQVVAQNLRDGVRYTYWTKDTKAFDRLRRRLQPLVADVDERIECVKVPEEANWFSFVIYNPLRPFDAETPPELQVAMYSEDGTTLARTQYIDFKTLYRITNFMKGTYEFLVQHPGESDDGYEWHHRIPSRHLKESKDGRG